MTRVIKAVVVAPTSLGLCRLCGEHSWLADATSAVHRCCARSEAAGETTCMPCRESKAAAVRRTYWS